MKLFLAVIFFSSLSLAHIEAGKWVGVTADGQACEMVVGDQYFENGLRHPLNERIPVDINGVKFVIGHPALIDAATANAGFNHDVFHGVVPNTTGANAVVVEMSHTEEYEGPKSFTFITHNYKSGTRSALACNGIKHVE